MSWDFETDPEFAQQLEWIDQFVRDEIEPVDLLVTNYGFDLSDPVRQALIPPLQQMVHERNLWACHLGPNLGGKGYGQVKLALMNEILGRSQCAPIVFGCQAPDSGNAEILAHYGSERLKETYLRPLVAGEVVSCYSMTEPEGGSDPTQFRTSAVPDGDEWVINGTKWYSSHSRFASFIIVLAVTDPDAEPHRRMSMFVVPADAPGLETIRNVALFGHERHDGGHGYLRYNNVRVPADHLLGKRGDGFVVSQTRLGGGRIHHAMRTVGLVRKALDMMCERVLSRYTQGERLADKQMVQEMLADSWTQLEQFRLLVLQTAWKIDKYDDYRKVRKDIAAVKATMPKVLNDVAGRALQLHGSLGTSDEMPFGDWIMESYRMGLADGATEIHKITVAKQLLRGRTPAPGLFPTGHLPALRAAAEAKFADRLAAVRGSHGSSGPSAAVAPSTAAETPVTDDAPRPDDMPEIADVRPGEELDWDRLVTYLSTALGVAAGAWSVKQFPNGSANLTYLVHVNDELSVVVRRPPLGTIAAGAHDMSREHRVLSRLPNAYPRAPRSLLVCEDPSIIGAPFDVMEYRPGVVVWRSIPEVLQVGDNVGHRIGLAVADALADLHTVDPASCDLADLGRPVGFLERQMAGWQKRWAAVASEAEAALMEEAATRLGRNVPTNPVHSLLHNDYQLTNVQFAAGDPDRVYSVFDWDMATLGDPLADLGSLLNYWPDPSDTAQSAGLYLPEQATIGLPTRAEMAERYAARSGFGLDNLGWYEAFAAYRVTVILQQLAARYQRGESTDPRMAERAQLVHPMAVRALDLLDHHGVK
ncbi:acyl-CoA dehydrogenase domain protein [Parafrankia sp. EAN1pec]|nr:acyl-CoA dehydrogenase domain protein [Frankia sp. EAN1pec]